MAEKLEHLNLKHRGQRGTITKNCQEASSLLDVDIIEPSSFRSLKTIQDLLEEKRAILKALDEEILEVCGPTEVEQEMVESEEVLELIVEFVDRIKSVITEKTGMTRETTLMTHESESVLSHDKTVCSNSDMEKSGAPVVEHDQCRSWRWLISR